MCVQAPLRREQQPAALLRMRHPPPGRPGWPHPSPRPRGPAHRRPPAACPPQECDRHIGQEVAQLRELLQLAPAAFLERMDAVWRDYCAQMLTIRSIFLYLDRTYVITTAAVKSLFDMGLQLFRKHLTSYPQVRGVSGRQLQLAPCACRVARRLRRPPPPRAPRPPRARPCARRWRRVWWRGCWRWCAPSGRARRWTGRCSRAWCAC
jgi:hypothetical protein